MCRGVNVHILLVLSMFFSSVSACSYRIEDLSVLVKIPSTVDMGTNVYNLTIGEKQPDRKKRAFEPYDSKEHDIMMLTNSSNFGLMFVDDHHEVIVMSCLVDGYQEQLYFVLNETLDTNNDCETWILRTSVEPANPVFMVPSAVNVSECMPGTSFDIVPLQFENGGSCSSWSCSANCTNDKKLFWTGDRALRTSSDDVTVNFTYTVMVTCFDDEAPEKIESQEVDTTGDIIIYVIFFESAICTQSTIQVSTAVQAGKQGLQQQQSPGYIDKTKTVALATSFGGLLLGLVAGIGTHCALKRFCRPVKVNSVI